MAAGETTLTRLLCDRVTGAVMVADPTRYRPDAATRHAVVCRDRHCRFPVCTARVRDLDHPANSTTPWICPVGSATTNASAPTSTTGATRMWPEHGGLDKLDQRNLRKARRGGAGGDSKGRKERSEGPRAPPAPTGRNGTS